MSIGTESVDKFFGIGYNDLSRKVNIDVFGVPDRPAEIAPKGALTREPETDHTGVGKDQRVPPDRKPH